MADLYYTLDWITVRGEYRIPPYTHTALDDVKNKQALIDAGAIRKREATPPYAVMPCWAEYDTMLADAGIDTLGDIVAVGGGAMSEIVGEDVHDLVRQTEKLLDPRIDADISDCCGGKSEMNLPVAT